MRQGSWPRLAFPNLTYGDNQNHRVTSRWTTRYNCIAWAADDLATPWWPKYAYWPDGVPKLETPDAFILAFGTKGYVQCADGSRQARLEKVAIYVDSNDIPTHAARQLRNGKWTSKLGDYEDITHNSLLDVADGPPPDGYGRPKYYVQRQRCFINTVRRFLLWLRIEVWEQRP
jgi:hypothetical protein